MGEALMPPKGGFGGSSGGGGSGDGSPITVSPTGEEFTVEGSFSAVTVEGDDNLRPENLPVGLTIYGVTGTMTVAANCENLPPAYVDYIETAKTYYTDDYENLFVSEDNEWITVGFMLSGFNVESYDSETTEFTAKKWVSVAYRKADGEWEVKDWSSDTSEGNNYINNMRYCTTIIYNNGVQIFPMNRQGATTTVYKTTGSISSASKAFLIEMYTGKENI